MLQILLIIACCASDDGSEEEDPTAGVAAGAGGGPYRWCCHALPHSCRWIGLAVIIESTSLGF